MDDPSNQPRYFEKSGTDPGTLISSSLPEVIQESEQSRFEQFAMPMVSHIEELRNRVLISVGTLAITLTLGFVYSLKIIKLFQDMAPDTILFVQLAAGEVLMSSLRVALYVGIGLALPVILYNTLRFVLPGLVSKEKAMVTWSVIGGTVLFLMGVVFSYFFIIPSALLFLVDYGQEVAHSQLSIDSYISFCSSLLFVTGLMFELPMVLFLLSFTGFVTSQRLLQEWRWAIVLIFIAAAIVTPTQDPLSLSLVAIPMIGLYAFSIIPIKLAGR